MHMGTDIVAGDENKSLIFTAPTTEMRNHLDEIKSSIQNLREGNSQDNQKKKQLPEEIALTKSVDSFRFQGRNNQGSRQSQNSQQLRPSEKKTGAAASNHKDSFDQRKVISSGMNDH